MPHPFRGLCRKSGDFDPAFPNPSSLRGRLPEPISFPFSELQEVLDSNGILMVISRMKWESTPRQSLTFQRHSAFSASLPHYVVTSLLHLPHPLHARCEQPSQNQHVTHSFRETPGGGRYPALQRVNVQTCERFCDLPSFPPLTPLESALPRPHAHNPCRMNTSKKPQICIKTKDFNPIKMNTSKTARPVQKTKDFKSTRMNTSAILLANPFRISTSKKEGGRGV